MNHTNIAINIDATAVAAQAGVDLAGVTPYGRGFNAVGIIHGNDLVAGAAGVAKIQTSPDNSTWTDAVVTTAGVKCAKYGQFALDRYVRANVTVAWTAGLVSFELLVS